MKTLLFLVFTLCGSLVFAELAATTTSTAPVTAPLVSTAVAIPPSAGEIHVVLAPVPEDIVPVPEPAAPPKWAIDLIMKAQEFPVVGPYITKALVYAGILGAILTALIAFLLTLLNALSTVFHISGATDAVNAIQKFKAGKIMYYLKFLSLFNAKKPDPK